MNNLILQVQVSHSNQNWGRRKFTYYEDLYAFSKQQAQEYSKITNSDYMCITDNSYLPNKSAIHQRFKMLELDQYDNILYIDSDAIVMPNCPNIFEIDYTGFAAVDDYDWSNPYNQKRLEIQRKKFNSTTHYPFCSGVMLTSKSWRQENKQAIFELLETTDLPDQDILNIVCKDTPYTRLSLDWGAWYKNSKYITHIGGSARKKNFDVEKFKKRHFGI